MQTINEAVIDAANTSFTHAFSRLLWLLYGIVAYAVGMAGLSWLMLAAGGLLPTGIYASPGLDSLAALEVNIALVLMFGLSHSLMARARFKRLLTRVVPVYAERSTFILVSGVMLALVLAYWQPFEGVIWSVDSVVATVLLYALYATGCVYLVAASFITNHFELFGLRQVYLNFRRQPYTELPFTRKWMYSYSRHPMMLGLLLLLWSTPTMSSGHFLIASLFTLYIIVGVVLEERDLERRFGDTYLDYRRRIGALFTIVRNNS